MNALGIETEPPLLFNWDSPRGEKLAITGFLTVSLILHALCFYVFQIVYPSAIVLLPPPARIHLIAPDSEENRTLLRWVEAEDPALASATLRPPEARLRALPKTRHIPSYLTEQPKLKELPPLTEDLRATSSQPPGPVPTQRRQAGNPNILIPTRVSFSSDLGGLGSAQLPPFNFKASTNESADNVRFRIAVGSRGDVRFCFALNSSGDKTLDEQARRYLALCRFDSRRADLGESDATLTWGVATIEWGNDITRPTSSPSSTPAP